MKKLKNMKKSVSERIKITGTGKVIRRTMGVGHFRTRKSATNLRRKGKTLNLDHPKKSFLSYASNT